MPLLIVRPELLIFSEAETTYARSSSELREMRMPDLKLTLYVCSEL